MKHYSVILLAAAMLLGGCGLLPPTPQNSNEYRALMKAGTPGAVIDTYVVDKSYNKVAKVIQKQAAKCLDTGFVSNRCTTSQSGHTNCDKVNFIYTPTIQNDGKKMELYVQLRTEPNRLLVGGTMPKNGIYVSVIDFEAVGKNKTRITAYHPEKSFTLTSTAVKHWAKGTNMGCPNMTEDMTGSS
ncbi:MAG: hypothetical protein OEZ39_19760 [Gammaproteobacteria bacterium]|nr:hypothetical protein [Gammaproteobacteria bacterium]MDH5654104.1 hypothetical protein [Gammaproteobacteria bacterium]